MRTFCFLLFSLFLSTAQSQTVIAENFHLPVGVEADAQGRIWVTESGFGFNDGAVSLVESNGMVYPVIVGLPSFFDTTVQEGVGPWHTLQLPGNKLAVTEGAIGKVLFFDLSGFVAGTSAPLTLSDTTSAWNIAAFVTSQGIMESDPYSLFRDNSGNLYLADAAANAIVKGTPSGELSIFATFPAFPNPLPFGPPMVDAVPTRIIGKPGGGFYVCQLTGFPFLPGAAQVFELDATGMVSSYASGLEVLTDMALDANTGDIYALQIGHFVLDPMLPPGFAPGSAKVYRIKPNGDREVVAQGFDMSAGMALDAQGNLYTADFGGGRLLKWASITTGIREEHPAVDAFAIMPNPASSEAKITFSLPAASTVQMRIYDVAGRMIVTKELGRLDMGQHQTIWQSAGATPGIYWVELHTETGQSVQKLVVK